METCRGHRAPGTGAEVDHSGEEFFAFKFIFCIWADTSTRFRLHFVA